MTFLKKDITSYLAKQHSGASWHSPSEGSQSFGSESTSNSSVSTDSDADDDGSDGSFSSLPYELFLIVCSFLSEEEYLTFLNVSRHFHRAITQADHVVWRSLCFSKWVYRQGCYNSILHYRLLEEENAQEERYAVTITQRMLPHCLNCLNDSNFTVTDGAPSTFDQGSLDLSTKDADEEKGNSSTPHREDLRRNVWEGKATHVSAQADKTEGQDDKFAPFSSPVRYNASSPRRHSKRKGTLRPHKHRNKRSHHHRQQRKKGYRQNKKGYRQHQKSNRKMSKSARRRLRHQRSKQRMLCSSPLQPTATYTAIKNSTPAIPANEVEPAHSLLTAGISRDKTEPRALWWNLSPEERQLRLSRRHRERERLESSLVSLPLLSTSQSETSSNSSRSTFSIEKATRRAADGGGQRSANQKNDRGNRRQVLQGLEEVRREGASGGIDASRTERHVSARGLRLTALEEAIRIVWFKCVGLCSLQRRPVKAAAYVMPFSPVGACVLSRGSPTSMVVASDPLPCEHPSRNHSLTASFCGTPRLEDDTDDRAGEEYGCISWKFAYYMSRREARRKTLTFHDLLNGTWMMCFRCSGRCHPVRFTVDNTAVVYPPLLLTGMIELPRPTPDNQVNMGVHILQGGSRVCLNSLPLAVHHRSLLAGEQCGVGKAGECSDAFSSQARFASEPHRTVAYIRKLAEYLVEKRNELILSGWQKVSRASESDPTELQEPANLWSLTTAIWYLFGWETFTDDKQTAWLLQCLREFASLPTCVGCDAEEAVGDDWGWTLDHADVKLFSVDLGSPLFIQRLQHVCEMQKNSIVWPAS